MSEENKAIATRLRQDLWNSGDPAIADEICAQDAVFHTNDPLTPDFGRGPTGLKQLVSMYRTAFPDARVNIEDIVAEGDRVAIRWTALATHTGNLGTVAPTNKSATVTGIDIVRISAGKIQEIWMNWDTLGMLQQIGVQQAAAAGG